MVKHIKCKSIVPLLSSFLMTFNFQDEFALN